MNLESELRGRLNRFVRGEITWAEVEGMTWERAKAIAQVGCDLAAAGRLEEARVIFEGLTAGNPKDAAASAALGTVYQKLGRHDEALAAYDSAIQVDAQNPVALANRGELLLKKGDQSGFRDLARASEADPEGATGAGRRAKGILKAMRDAVEKAQRQAAQ